MSQTDPVERKFWLERLTPMRKNMCRAIQRAYRAGAMIGFGTDCAPGQPQYANGVEFRFRAEDAGMAPIEVLKQATAYNAAIAGIEEKTGCIKAGLDADLVLVDGNPDENMEVMYHLPFAVWKAGKRVAQ